MIFPIFFLALAGLCLSFYAYLIEIKLKKNPQYSPVCDISENISCIKPLRSPYARLFYFSNSVVGMFFYGLLMICAYMEALRFIFILSLLSVLLSVFLEYILLVKIKTVCLVCNALYVINVLIFLAAWYVKGTTSLIS